MWRFLRLFCVAAVALIAVSPAIAPGEIIYYAEDFESNGVAGFDPIFEHAFSADPGVATLWFLFRSTYPGHVGEYALALGNGTTDRITFNVPCSENIQYASVTLYGGLGPETSVRFIGSQSTWESGPGDYGKTFVETSAAQVGSIGQIVLYSTQGIFFDVTIGVVPEPTDDSLVAILVAFVGTIAVLLRPVHR